MATNRRSHPRYNKRLRARFHDKDVWRACFTADISVTGIFFESLWLPRENRVQIEIFAVGNNAIPLVGELIRGARVPPALLRAAKGGFAVKLTQSPLEWSDYCATLMQRTLPPK